MIAAPDLERREMFAEIKKLCTPDNYTNWFYILSDYAVLAATIAVCMTAYNAAVDQGRSVLWVAPLYALSVLIIGAWVQSRLSGLVHEAAHYSLFKSRKLNDFAANWFLLFPIFGVIANYRTGHWAHHRHVNDEERDPDLARLRKHHPRNFPISKRRFLLEYVLLQILPHKTISYLIGRALYVAIPMKSDQAERDDALGGKVVLSLRLIYYALLFGALTVFGWWPHYFLFWIIPFVTVYPAVIFLREIAHHGNYPDDGDFTNSRVYNARWWERGIFFPYSEDNHVLHHMFPTIPHYRVHTAHATMLRYPPYREQVVTCNGYFVKADPSSDEPTVLDLLAAPADAYLRRKQEAEPAAMRIRAATGDEVGARRENVDSVSPA